MARWIPASSRPGTGRSRGRVAPPASTTLSNSSTSDRALTTVASGATAPRHLGVALPHRDPAPELDAFGPHLVEPAVEHRLLHLELGDPVAEQPPGLLGPLEHHHLVAGPGQLLGGGQPGRARTRPRPPACRWATAGRTGVHPALGPGPLDDLVLDPLDGHRVVVDAQHAGTPRTGPGTAGR